LHAIVEEGLDHYGVAMADPEGNEFDINQLVPQPPLESTAAPLAQVAIRVRPPEVGAEAAVPGPSRCQVETAASQSTTRVSPPKHEPPVPPRSK
jgi:hypothetical protein